MTMQLALPTARLGSPDVSLRLVRLCALSLVMALSACSSTPDCEDRGAAYRQAQDRPTLQVPPDLSLPDKSSSLTIPQQPAGAGANVRPMRAGACLDSPPSYFGSAGQAARTPDEMLADWAQAWADRNADAVGAMYSPQFQSGTEAGSAAWIEQRREEVATGAAPTAKLKDVKISGDGERRVVTLVQRFSTNAIKKELTLVRENGVWRIVSERVLGVE